MINGSNEGGGRVFWWLKLQIRLEKVGFSSIPATNFGVNFDQSFILFGLCEPDKTAIPPF